MRTAVKVGLSLAVVLGFMLMAQAEDKKAADSKEVTLKGTMVCGKCDAGHCQEMLQCPAGQGRRQDRQLSH